MRFLRLVWIVMAILALVQFSSGATYELNCCEEETVRFDGELSTGDKLSLVLPDNERFDLDLVEKSPSKMDGEAFLCRVGGSSELLTASVVRGRRGLRINFTSSIDSMTYLIRSKSRGTSVRKVNPVDFLRRPSPSRYPSRRPSVGRRLRALRRAQNGGPVTVDVMVAYEKGAQEWLDGEDQDAETFALSAVARMNIALANTGLSSAFRFRLVGVLSVNARSSDFDAVLDAVTVGTGAWAAVSRYRDEVGADIVTTLIDTGSASGMTGLSWSLTDEYGTGDYSWFADLAYNVCSIRSVEISHTMTHEVGHNMGAGHSDIQSAQAGPQLFDYSSGYYFTVNGRSYHTIMAYFTDGRTSTIYEEVPFFSSPLHTYEGVAVGDVTHDNALTLKQTFGQVADFRAAKTDPCEESEKEGTPVLHDDDKPGGRVDVGGGEAVPYAKAAVVYDGCLVKDGVIKGVIQVKVAKAKKSKVEGGGISAKVTATVQLADGSKKISFKGGVADEAGRVTGLTAAGCEIDVSLGVNGLGGTFRRAGDSAPYQVDGARNLFSAKDKEAKDAVKAIEDAWVGAVNVVGDDVVLSVAVAKKGKVKVSGTVKGAKVSATSQLLVGAEACCVPVVITKKANLAFNLWLMADGTVEVRGADSVTSGEDAASPLAGKAGELKAGAKFRMDYAALSRALTELYRDYLPNGVGVAQSGTKWVVAGGAKAGKLALVKGTSEIDLEKSKFTDNMSGLKLTYKAKDGSFKGSFKVYNLENGKIKAYTANVTGVMIGNTGYGTATIKKPFVSLSVAIE